MPAAKKGKLYRLFNHIGNTNEIVLFVGTKKKEEEPDLIMPYEHLLLHLSGEKTIIGNYSEKLDLENVVYGHLEEVEF